MQKEKKTSGLMVSYQKQSRSLKQRIISRGRWPGFLSVSSKLKSGSWIAKKRKPNSELTLHLTTLMFLRMVMLVFLTF